MKIDIKTLKPQFTRSEKWVFWLFVIFLLFPLTFNLLDISTCFMNRYILVCALIASPILLYFSRHSPKELSSLEIARLNNVYKNPLSKRSESVLRFGTALKIYTERALGITMLICFWGYFGFLLATEGSRLLSC